MTATAGLQVDATAHRGAFTLDVAVDLPDGEVLAVLGANGSGKSTLLDVVAGALAVDRGHVSWRGRPLSTADGVSVPIAARRVGLLRQDPLLFPHLSVLENVAFGVRAQRGADPRVTAQQWIDRLGVAPLAERRPRQLSGGQAARVAIARALAAGPELLLLDEPLAALDATAAPELRALLADVVREERLTTVLVSHGVLDAALLADRLLVLREGSVVEQGSREAVLTSPRTAFTAAFVGVNFVPVGFAGLRASTADDGEIRGLRFRPSAVEVSTSARDGVNSWRASVRWLEPATGGIRVRLATPDGPDVLADLDPAAVDGDLLRPGTSVWAHVPPEAVQAV